MTFNPISSASTVPRLDRTPGGSDLPHVLTCEFCRRPFRRLEHLQRHKRTHTKEKPFCCSTCPRSFTRRDLLVRHEKVSHGRSLKKAQAATAASPRLTSSAERRQTHYGLTPEERSVIQSSLNPLQTSRDDRERPPLSSSEAVVSLRSSTNNGSPLRETSADADRLHRALPDYELVHRDQIELETAISAGMLEPNIDFSSMLDGSVSFMDTGSMTYQDYSTTFPPDQPVLSFVPELSFDHAGSSKSPYRQEYASAFPYNSYVPTEESGRSRSTLPYLQPELWQDSIPLQGQTPQSLCEVTVEDCQQLMTEIDFFSPIILSEFVLPSQHVLSRYMSRYVGGFHNHLPFLHVSTLSIKTALPELILAIAAVGSQYSFERVKAVELFNVSRGMTLERIHRRKAQLRARLPKENLQPTIRSTQSRFMITPTLVSGDSNRTTVEQDAPTVTSPLRKSEDVMQIAQALLLLLVMATWGSPWTMSGEALELQSILAIFIREERLLDPETPIDGSWTEWIRVEGAKRTVLIAFCFFTFHTIFYNTTPSILNAELRMNLPSSEAEWRCSTATAWKEEHRAAKSGKRFLDSLTCLFSDAPDTSSGEHSSLGGYVLILALIQHIFLIRQVCICQPKFNGRLPTSEESAVERALKNWHHLWKKNPESSLGPLDASGSVAFNSTALLRMAYIRLNVDIGPARALDTRDPVQIARAMFHRPSIQRSKKFTQVAFDSAGALSIVVKLGVDLIAHNQIFTWSLQHSLCALECAFVLSKWLEAVTIQPLDPPCEEGELKLLDTVADLLAETDAWASSTDLGNGGRNMKLSTRVVKVWAKLFRGERIWDVVDMVGRALDEYGDLLDSVF